MLKILFILEEQYIKLKMKHMFQAMLFIYQTVEQIKARCEELQEFNPMMGHRGCRLAVSYPEICEMQTTAIIKAAINVQRKTKKAVTPEIMVPLVLEAKELKFVKNIICQTADKLIKEAKINLKYSVGTMIEIPRAALLADEIAKEAEFFSFGTNDLTQMTFGFSRDDVTKFLPDYYSNKILEEVINKILSFWLNPINVE